MSVDTEFSLFLEDIHAGMDAGLHRGVQAYVSLQGDVLLDEAFGASHEGETLTRDHLVLWLSAGKPLMAVAIAQLYEQGKLDFDDPVTKFIPAFAQHGKDGITLRHLLTHTGGFRLAPFNFPKDDWDTIIRKICEARLEPRWTPGEKAGYHVHSSWFILGEVIQRITGLTCADYVRQNICEPLSMLDTWLGMPTEVYEQEQTRIAPMPEVNLTTQQFEQTDFHTRNWVVNCRPGGNAFGPVRELGWFYEAMLGGGQRMGSRVLSEQTVSLLTHRHRKAMYDHTFRHNVDWGLGFILNSCKGECHDLPYSFGKYAACETFGHGGAQSSVGFADPTRGLVVAVVCLGMPGEEVHRKRMYQMLNKLYEGLGFTEGCGC